MHCYNYWRRGERPKRTLCSEQVDVHRKTLQEIIDSGVFHVTLTGGEPLGVLEQLFSELLALKQAGIKMSMNTNLALLNTDMIELLRQLSINSILTSLMSVDSSLNDELAQRKGAFRRTVTGIRLAVASGFRVSVNMVVSQKNFHTIYETGKLAKELGARAFCATKASKPSNCEDFRAFSLSIQQLGQMFQELLRIKGDFGLEVASLEHYPACVFPDDDTRTAFGNRNCSAAKTSCSIGFDGGVRPCSHAPMSYGNVVSEGLNVSWGNMNKWRDGGLVPQICHQQCGEFPSRCGGGCRIESLNANMGLAGSDPYCLQTKPVAERKVGIAKLISPNSQVKLCAQVRFRPEVFGYIAYRSSTNWMAIDSTLYDLLVVPTSQGRTITVGGITRVYQSSSEDALKTLSILKSKGIVELVRL